MVSTHNENRLLERHSFLDVLMDEVPSHLDRMRLSGASARRIFILSEDIHIFLNYYGNIFVLSEKIEGGEIFPTRYFTEYDDENIILALAAAVEKSFNEMQLGYRGINHPYAIAFFD